MSSRSHRVKQGPNHIEAFIVAELKTGPATLEELQRRSGEMLRGVRTPYSLRFIRSGCRRLQAQGLIERRHRGGFVWVGPPQGTLFDA